MGESKSRVQAAIRRDEPVTGRATPLGFVKCQILYVQPLWIFVLLFCYVLVQQKPGLLWNKYCKIKDYNNAT